MSDEKTLTVEGSPNIPLSATRRVVKAYEEHERAQDNLVILHTSYVRKGGNGAP